MTDRDPQPHPQPHPLAAPSASPVRIPLPEAGLGSHELEIDSDDPVVLRQALQRARERLAFYESFDRIIGENVKRSGELMLETIALREAAQAAEESRLAREAEIERERQAERTRAKALLTDLHGEIAGFQSSVETLRTRVADALQALDPEDGPDAGAAPEAAQTNEVTDPDPATVVAIAPVPSTPEAPAQGASETPPKTAFRPIRQSASASTAAPTTPTSVQPEPEEPDLLDAEPAIAVAEAPGRAIDLVVHGIARATTALAFQRELTGLAGVRSVETREFAEGVLRLKVEVATDDALGDAAFAAWGGPGPVTVVTRQPTLIALDLPES